MLTHIKKDRLFEGQPFPCPKCICQGIREEEVERIEGREAWEDHIQRVYGGIQTLAGEVLQDARAGRGRRRRRVQKARASIEIETDSDVDYGPSCRKRRRISGHSDGGSRDISEAPTLVDMNTPERTVDEDREITSRINPRLAVISALPVD
jgi:hypothetical protein